jgi:hypothetical protein
MIPSLNDIDEKQQEQEDKKCLMLNVCNDDKRPSLSENIATAHMYNYYFVILFALLLLLFVVIRTTTLLLLLIPPATTIRQLLLFFVILKYSTRVVMWRTVVPNEYSKVTALYSVSCIIGSTVVVK